ncbi:WD40 repeat protein [Bradyrhizobium sp. USDA 4369]
MSDQLASIAPAAPFGDAAEMRGVNAGLLEAMDRRLGRDSSPESEAAALQELEAGIRIFLDRGAATGTFVEDIKERTACQVLLDYWSSTLSHAGMRVTRSRLAPFDAARLPDLSDQKCPYVGLESFRNNTFFFGRESAVANLLQRVREIPLVVVQGGSGSGKSSLVMGGAFPVLAAAEHAPRFRVIGPFTPGNTMLENLIDALRAPNPDVPYDRVAEAEILRANPALLPKVVCATATPVLLVVDQFEEIFTLCKERDRAIAASAIDALLKSSPDCRVILTLREEFTNELDKLEPLRPYFARHARFSMKEWPMGYDELRAAIERPAALVNLHFAPGIIDDLVKSVLGQDTALPLLQFALQSLWKQRDHNRVTREAYERVGSPLVALERYADGFYSGLSPENQKELQRVLLELVRIDRMMEAYREPRMRSALLESGNPRTDEVLKMLAREDFLRITPTADNDATVEVKHEALLRNWPRYVEWIGGKREGVRQRVALTEAAQRWDARGRSRTTDLLSPWQLHDAQRLTGLTQLEKDYLQSSEDYANAEQRARDRERRFKYFFAALGVVVLVVLFDSLLWVMNAQTARERSQVLEEFAHATEASYRGQIDDALTETLEAGLKMTMLPDQVQAALRPQLREALLSTLQNATQLKRLFVKDGGTFNAVAFHPTRSDTLIAFGGSDGQIYLATLGHVGEPFPNSLKTCGDDQGVSALAFASNGHLLVAGCRSGKLAVWSADDWHPIGSQQVSQNFIRSLSIRPDGRLVAVSGGKHVALVQLDEQGAPSKQTIRLAEGNEASGGGVQTVAFSPDGDTLVAGDGDGNIFVCKTGSAESWDCRNPQGYQRVENDAILTLAYSPDGRQIAVGHYWRGAVDLWDAQFSADSRRTIYHQSPSAVYGLTFFKACKEWQLAIGTNAGLEYSPIGDGLQQAGPVEFCARARWAQIGDQVYSVAFDSRSGLIAAATQSGYVAILDPAGKRDPLRERVVQPKSSKIRGALLAEKDSAAWVALQNPPTKADPSNVTILKLDEERGEDVVLHFAAGTGEIQRLAASPQTLRLATIGCIRSPDVPDCLANDPYEVIVWQFTELMDAPTRIVSLTNSDFIASDFQGRAPVRAILSPDGRWLVVSFLYGSAPTARDQDSPQPLFVLRLNDPGKGMWIDSNLRRVREIAFSIDSKMFAAGGCCATDKAENNRDQIRLWSVDGSGFTPRRSALTLTPLAKTVQDLAFASDKKGIPMLLVGGRFGTIYRWVLNTKEATEMRVDTHGVSFIAFSHDESLVAAADSQGVVRLWDTSRWLPFELTPNTDDPAAPGFLAFSMTGARLISSADKLDFWDLDPAQLQRKVCSLLREVGPNGVDRETPWHADRECKEGALTHYPHSFPERVRDFFMRAWAVL